jgi:hypothetical protein
VKGEGSVGTVEDASLVPRRRFERDNHDEGHNNADNFKSSNLLIGATIVLLLSRF